MLTSALLFAAFAVPVSAEVPRSVVRIYTVFRKPDYYQPWQMTPQNSATGSGCIISGNRILTNAHVVSDQVFVQVRKAGDSARYTARVDFVAHDSELALLTVEDPDFFRETEALPLGQLPKQRDPVTVYGFPDGGEDLSVTQGIVSRIEVTPYTHADRDLLTIQTDAAINPGNSGGPMVQDGKLVGVSFQMQAESENVGYAVPAPLVQRFLDDVKDGAYDGIPDLGIHWQALENKALRDWLGMKPGETGVRVSAVAFGAPGSGVIEPNDVILGIGGVSVGYDGTIPLDKVQGSGRNKRSERVHFSHLLVPYQAGQTIAIEVLRDGKRLKLSLQGRRADDLVPGPRFGEKPSYFVYAGLVFTPLTRNYIDNWEWNNVSTAFKSYVEFGLPTPERKQIILLAHVLPHAVNAGYHDFRGIVIDAVNGKKIASMKDLPAAFAAPQGKYHVITTDPFTDWSGRIVLDAELAEKASVEIVERFDVPSDRSEDLRKENTADSNKK